MRVPRPKLPRRRGRLLATFALAAAAAVVIAVIEETATTSNFEFEWLMEFSPAVPRRTVSSRTAPLHRVRRTAPPIEA